MLTMVEGLYLDRANGRDVGHLLLQGLRPNQWLDGWTKRQLWIRCNVCAFLHRLAQHLSDEHLEIVMERLGMVL